MTYRRLRTTSSAHQNRHALLCSSALIGIGMLLGTSPASAQTYPISSGGTVDILGSATVTDDTAGGGGVSTTGVNGTVTLSGLNIVASGGLNGFSSSGTNSVDEPAIFNSASPNSIRSTSGNAVYLEEYSGAELNYSITGPGGDYYGAQATALTMEATGEVTFQNNGAALTTLSSSNGYAVVIETDGRATMNAGLMDMDSINGAFIRGSSATFTSTGGSLSSNQNTLVVASDAYGNTTIDSQSAITSGDRGIQSSSAYGISTIKTSGNGTIDAQGTGLIASGRGTIDIGANITANDYGIQTFTNGYSNEYLDLTNRATIHATNSNGVMMGGGTIYNVGTIESVNASAVSMGSGFGQILNYGVLDGGNGIGIYKTGSLYAELHAGSSSGTVIATGDNNSISIETGTGTSNLGYLDDYGVGYLLSPGTHDATRFDAIQLGGGTNYLYLDGNGTNTLATGAAGTLDIGTITFSPSGTLNVVKEDSGNWELTGDLTAANTIIHSGTGSEFDGGYLTFNFNSIANGADPIIYVNGAAIVTNTAGGFGTDTIHAVDPTIIFGAAGTYSNDVSLEVASVNSGNPFNVSTTPTTFSAASGLAVTLSGAITTETGTNINGDDIGVDQPVVFTNGGQFLLTNSDNHWTGSTTIGANTTLTGTAATISGSSIVDNGVLVYDQATNATVAQPISGSGDLTKLGAGNLTLTGSNSYTGTTTISAGSLTGSSGSIAGTAIVNNGALIYDQATNGTASQVISGTGTLTKTGAGNLTLSGANSNSGAITITAGTLTGTTSSIVGSNVVNNAALVFDQSVNGSYAYLISGSGSLTKAGTGALTLGITESYTGATTISGGKLSLGASGDISSSSAVALSGATAVLDTATNGASILNNLTGVAGSRINTGLTGVTINQTANGTFAGVIDGNGLVKNGTATLALAGTNTLTGAVTVNAGTLALTGNGSIATASGLSLTQSGSNLDISGVSAASASLQQFNGVAGSTVTLGNKTLSVGGGSFGGVLSGTGGLTTGAGGFALSASQAYTGATTVTGGTLTLASGVKLASNAVVLSGATAVLDASNSVNFSIANLSGVAGSQLKVAGLVTLGSASDSSFAGNIVGGSGLTKVGTGTTTLSGANTVSGPVLINAGMLAVAGGQAISDRSVVTVASGATFAVSGTQSVANLGGSGVAVVNAGSTLTFGSDNAASSFGGLGGAGALVKTGSGTFTLTGNSTLAGLTTVSGGKLVLAANMAGGVSVLQGASLAGSGTVGALTVAAGGTLNPGASDGAYGTIRASSLTSAGTIRIDFGGVSTGLASDKIIVSGAINITGGMIDAHPTSATTDYTFNQYFALSAGTTFTGTFTNSTDWVANTYDPRLKQRIRYDLGAGAVLEVRYLQDLTTGLPTNSTGNAFGVATALNGTQQGASDSFAMLINALADQTPAARQQTLQELSGEASVSGNEMAGATLSSFLSTVGAHAGGGAAVTSSQTMGYLNAIGSQTRLGAVVGLSGNRRAASPALEDERRAGLWMQGYGVNQRIDASGGLARTKTTGVGIALGADMSTGNGAIFGVALGYAEPKTKVGTLRSSTKGDALSAALYAGYNTDALQLAGTVGYATTKIRTNRSVVAGALSLAPRGSTRSNTLGATLSAGYRIDAGDAVAITPKVSAEYTHDRTRGFAETNGGVANLRYSATTLDRWITKAGVELSKAFDADNYTVTPSIRGGAAAAFGDRALTSTAGFLAAPAGTGSFLVQGARLPKNWATAGVGLTVSGPHSPISVSIDYDGGFSRRYRDHQVTGTLRYQF